MLINAWLKSLDITGLCVDLKINVLFVHDI